MVILIEGYKKILGLHHHRLSNDDKQFITKRLLCHVAF